MSATATATEKFEYTFKSGSKLTGTYDEILKLASALGEPVDVKQLSGKTPRGFYPSESKGLIKISEMSDFHLRRALIKATKEYFASVFSATDSNSQFIEKYQSLSTDNVVADLFTELRKR